MENKQYFFDALKKLISFKSVKGEPLDGKPFGEEVYKAYDYFMTLSSNMGFETINYDNYIGEVVYGQGEELGIIGHLDVVPAGDGWDSDPFTLTLKDGVYYGRGLQDDKAPLLICLFVLKELKDGKFPCNKKIRLIVGCNEESGWQDVEYFKTKSNFPEYGFSPDGNFPVSYAEKGMNIVKFYLPTLKNFSCIKGGTVVNAVCGNAWCRATDNGIDLDLIKKHNLILKDGNVIESVGKSCHGSRPELGKNALKPLFEYFLDMGEDVQNVIDCLFNDKGGLKNMVNEQGDITFSPDLIEEENGKIIITCDCRIPAPLSLADIIPVFDSFGIEYDAEEKHDAVMVDKDGEFVQTLLNAYKTVTGRESNPISQSGSTFARAFKKGVAFGPEFEDESSSIHEANERISEKSLYKLYSIYKKAIFDLVK